MDWKNKNEWNIWQIYYILDTAQAQILSVKHNEFFQRTIHMDKSIYNHMLEANLMLLRLLLILKKLKH